MIVNVRGLLVVALLFGLLLAKRLVAQRSARLATQHVPVDEHQSLPHELVGAADRTWVLFTTPYCATCTTVAGVLGERDPDAPVVTVDATRRVDLSDRFAVRSAPTLLLADRTGRVLERHDGAVQAIAAVRALPIAV